MSNDDDDIDEAEGPQEKVPVPIKVETNTRLSRPKTAYANDDEVWIILGKDVLSGKPSRGRVIGIMTWPWLLSTYYAIQVDDRWHRHIEMRTHRDMASTEAAAKCLGKGDASSTIQRLTTLLRGRHDA